MGCWTKWLLSTATCCTPLEHQILAAYWALLVMEVVMGVGPVLLHTPVMSRVASQQQLGTAINSFVLRWKWYLQEWAHPDMTSLSRLQEHVAFLLLRPC